MRIGVLLLMMAFPSVFAGEAKHSDIEGVWCQDATSGFQLGAHDKNAGLTFDKQGCWYIHVVHADHGGGVAKVITDMSKDIKNVYPIKRHVLEVFDEKEKQYTVVSPSLLAFYIDGSKVHFSYRSLSIDGTVSSGIVGEGVLKLVRTVPANGEQLSTASVKYVKMHKVKDHVGDDFNERWQTLKDHLARVKSKLRTDPK